MILAVLFFSLDFCLNLLVSGFCQDFPKVHKDSLPSVPSVTEGGIYFLLPCTVRERQASGRVAMQCSSSDISLCGILGLACLDPLSKTISELVHLYLTSPRCQNASARLVREFS